MAFDISFLQQQVRQGIEDEIVQISRNPVSTQSGLFGVPRQVFCVVDFLGSVAYNSKRGERGVATTRKATRFIKEFFPRKYRDYADLLLAIWRHGTVHGFVPYVYYIYDGRKKISVKWSSNNDWTERNRAVNLEFFDIEGDPDSVCLSVNVCELADDLMESLEALIARMEREPSFRRACERRLARALEPKFVQAMPAGNAVKARVKSQIISGTRSTAGIIVNRDQVRWY